MLARFLGALRVTLMLAAGVMVAGPVAAQQVEGTAGEGVADTPFRPVALVNESVITGFDVDQRARLLAVLGFPAASAEALRAEALNQLIDDRLKMQEAERFGIGASEEEIRDGIARLAERANAKPEAFFAALAERGISRQALEDMVAAEVAWRKVIRQRFLARAEPGDAEIDAEIALMRERALVNYRLADIGLPVAPDGSNREKVRALAERIYRELSAGGDFRAAVRRYSRSPSAARGGELGWVQAQQLPPEMAEVLAELEVGEVSPPIEVSGGFSIVKILDKQVSTGASIRQDDPQLREQVRRQLLSRQVARLAEGRLQELRRDAVIELR